MTTPPHVRHQGRDTAESVGDGWENPRMHNRHRHPTPASGMPPTRLVAYVDESMRRVDPTTMCYFMAGAVLAEDRCDAVRDVLQPLARRATKRIHWRDEELRAKELIVKTVLTAKVESVVVVGAMIDHTNQERARQQVLKHLLYELDQRQVSHALLESRHAERDRHDTKSIGQFRNAHYLSRRLSVSHGQPLQEPLLWLPDIVAGAAGDHRCGENQVYELLKDLVHLRDLGSV